VTAYSLLSSHSMLVVFGWMIQMIVMVMLSWLTLYYLFNNVVNYLVDVCFMHVIAYRCKSNIWLN
jgi:hypothetical protein